MQANDAAVKFSETSTGGPVVTALGTPVGGYIYAQKQTTELVLRWHQVPEFYVADTTDDNYFILPRLKRILAHLGSTNNAAFCGHRTGTLLFDQVSWERYQQPVPTDSEWGLYAYDIDFRFVQFDPRKAPTVTTNPPGGAELYGHNTLPWRNNSYWYAATRAGSGSAGSTTGDKILPDSNFAHIFEHVANPAIPYPS
jgi:hypothetical protein